METLVLIIMMLVVLGFSLKLSFHSMPGIIATSVLAAVFTALVWDAASARSTAQIQDWLSRPALMLDTSVLLTADVFLQMVFCVLSASATRQRVLFNLLLWFPGILIFPVLFAALVELIFALPGVDFELIGWTAAVAVLAGAPLLALACRALAPYRDSRLEFLFLINALIAALGVVATVNGRTAARGATDPALPALAALVALIAVCAAAGFFIGKHHTKKKIAKI